MKHNLQKLDIILLKTSWIIFHLIIGIFPSFFNKHTCFGNSMLVFSDSFLSDLPQSRTPDLNVLSFRTKSWNLFIAETNRLLNKFVQNRVGMIAEIKMFVHQVINVEQKDYLWSWRHKQCQWPIQMSSLIQRNNV